jgi:hypothetical protein
MRHVTFQNNCFSRRCLGEYFFDETCTQITICNFLHSCDLQSDLQPPKPDIIANDRPQNNTV